MSILTSHRLMLSIPPASMRSTRLFFHTLVAALAVRLAFPLATAAGEAAAAPPSLEADVRPILARYCHDCHAGDSAESGIALDRMREEGARTVDRAAWLKILRQLEGRVMPPADAPQPGDAEVAKITNWIRGYALVPDCSGGERPGRVTLRRLNRSEYNFTVQDLFGIAITPADSFPSDDVGYGFDSIGDVLSLPPVLLERYLEAADAVARAVVASTDIDAAPVQVRPGKTFPSKGEMTASFDKTVGGAHVVRIRAWGDQAGGEPCEMEVSLDGKSRKVFKVPNRRDKPLDYEIKSRLPEGPLTVTVGFLNDFYDPNAPDPKARDRNLHVDAVTLIGPIGVLPEELPEAHRRLFARPIPADADSDAKRDYVAALLKPVASRAFRRRATQAEIDGLVTIFLQAREAGETFERSIQLALSAILVSPSFLFRVEQDPPPGRVRDLDDVELASRLSYFLWSSLPDDALFREAAAGRLHTDAQLVAAASRLLADARSDRLVDTFVSQWLQLRTLDDFSPDSTRFPTFDADLKASMRKETEAFFRAIIREDRSVLECLDSDSTFVDERLARHYGISGVTGAEVRRVSVDPRQRGGLLGQAAILAVTSNPTRTSPVKRGKWILENLFAAPPPPAPPNVPELEAAGGPLSGSLRERMEQHRTNPACASCHRLMDPLGFGLETYDAIGAWRTHDGEVPVDASGSLPDGRRFDGPAELRRVLKDRTDEFRRCFAEKLMTYALGRGLEYYDACAVERIAGRAAEEGDRFSVYVREIVRSPAFRQREGKHP
jgi:mono/diheme cytochrome c family protein